ncbi:protein transport protein HofB [Nicoletella semolina]|uniref:Protein transport protein HofB n=1 Tax=Nicoletella semolina TaxID=271160 RepID=A0A4R2NCV0_9PAST|nr:GspE/PulE family protein [Nicoletella semolina]MDH2924154.1 protein transporter HofB [Nicoletella semolina]TCP18950.1 protein transport protein HofB [Nicoletella semolina]
MKEKEHHQYAICERNSKRVFHICEKLWQKNIEQKMTLLRYLALPIQETEDKLYLAIDDEKNLNACETFAFLWHKKIEPILVSSDELKYLLNALSPENNYSDELLNVDYATQQSINKQVNFTDPIIQILDSLFKFCIIENASDIHIEPRKMHLVIRLRIDGVLHLYKTFSHSLTSRITSRLKLLAKLDISESRLPQDGQFSFTTLLGDTLDFRVSTLPCHYGEKLVLRLQKNKPTHFDFITLGFTTKQQKLFLNMLKQPQGLILVTGPTGSGKSITLYSALNYLNQTDKHILTAEDPIEIEIDGLVQTQVNPALQLDFSYLLRTFLRQDPDIIMLGEIRDKESAKIALQAAQTGHLVLSTLHTNDALSAIERLYQLGIQEYEIHNALLLVVAQRLVRKICLKCEGIGCGNCYQGYKGRIGIYQLLSRTTKYFDKQTAYLDYATLLQSAKQKINDKQTNLAEVERVLGDVENI